MMLHVLQNKLSSDRSQLALRLMKQVAFGFACFAAGYVASNPVESKSVVLEQIRTVSDSFSQIVSAALDKSDASPGSLASSVKQPDALVAPGTITESGDLVSKLVSPYLDSNAPTSGTSTVDKSEQDALPHFDRELVLNDADNRIASDFKIPAGLRDRVGFWFDVYTKYDSNRRIIHHSRYPWIVFKVIDVTSIINSDTPRFTWMRNQKADNLVKAEANKIRQAIASLARKKSLDRLNETEQLVADALKQLSGNLKKEARKAMGEVRVQVGQRNFFADGLEASPRYLGTMEKIFLDNRLPVELTRIPFVESSFNKHATSKVGATGIWQFMGNTGRKFMLVNDLIDERRSPFKATEGAARLLKENHLILHRSWPLAVTAWNHGPSGIRKAMEGAGSRDLSVIVSKYRSRTFDFASSNFYSEFLAALHAERYNEQIFGPLNRVSAVSLQAVKIPRKVRFNDLLKVSGMSLDEFLLLNPELKKVAQRNLNIPSGFKVHIPVQAWPNVEQLFAEARPKDAEKKSAG